MDLQSILIPGQSNFWTVNKIINRYYLKISKISKIVNCEELWFIRVLYSFEK